MSASHGDYEIHLDEKFGPLEVIGVAAEAAAHEPWFNHTLTRVNDTVVRLGVIEGDFHWHQHDDQDECFLVMRHALHARVGAHGHPDGRGGRGGADGRLGEGRVDRG
jgi:hypothetical protein